jgi:nucleoside-diphosphate-sugar epimerase
VDDVAEGLLRLGVAPAAPGEVVNLATGKLMSVKDFASLAAQKLHLRPERLGFGRLPTRTEEMSHEPVNIGRLRTLTGWQPPTPVEAGITRTFAED